MGMFGNRTQLSGPDEVKYQDWRSRLPENLRNEGDYDLRGAFHNNAKEAANGHLPDTYKLPNHITFSTGSQYSNDEAPGGKWVDTAPNRWAFWASPENLRYHSVNDLSRYFEEYEPNSTLILPSLGWSLK